MEKHNFEQTYHTTASFQIKIHKQIIKEYLIINKTTFFIGVYCTLY